MADPRVVDDADGRTDWEQLDIGRPIQLWDSSAWLRATTLENDESPDDVLQNCLDLPVYSARLREALEKAGVRGLQYLLVRVFRPRGEELEGISIANIVERRRALDLSRTDYDVFPDEYFLSERRGLIRAIRRVALRADALKDVDIVRLDEFPPSVYVSDNFKKAFEEGRFTGYSLHEVVTG